MFTSSYRLTFCNSASRGGTGGTLVLREVAAIRYSSSTAATSLGDSRIQSDWCKKAKKLKSQKISKNSTGIRYFPTAASQNGPVQSKSYFLALSSSVQYSGEWPLWQGRCATLDAQSNLLHWTSKTVRTSMKRERFIIHEHWTHLIHGHIGVIITVQFPNLSSESLSLPPLQV